MNEDRPEIPMEGTMPAMGRTSRGTTTDPLVGRQLGDYVIRRVIGRGGMGSVYEAFHLHLHRTVAIKVLAPHLLDDPRAVERFRREMRAIGRLNSPYVVQALDASLTGEIHYLVMEFIDGLDADELVRRLHGVPVEDASEIVRQASLGLQDAHRHDLVHRDIKPKNIAISRAGQVKILDLGLALCRNEVLATGRLTAQAAIGSYQYMAPEQFDDSHEVDIRADIYSLGCTLFHLLVGDPPFSGSKFRTLTSLMEAHRTVPPPSVSEFNGMVPEPLSAILARMLAKRPEDRIQTPGEIADLMAPFSQGANLKSIVAMASDHDAASQTHVATMIGSHSTDPSRADQYLLTQPSRPRWALDSQPTQELRRARSRRRWLMIAGAASVGGLGFLIGITEYQSRQVTSDRGKVARWLQLIPGLNGNWWLDETPWWLPSVRASVAEVLAPGSSGLEIPLRDKPVTDEQTIQSLIASRDGIDVQKLQHAINDLSARLVKSASPVTRDTFFFIQKDDPETIDDMKLRSKLQQVADQVVASDAKDAPQNIHLLAITLHKRGVWAEAEKQYVRALSLFDAITPTPLLASLCSSDFGEMLFAMGRFDDAALRYRLAAAQLSEQESQFPEFLVYALCREADSLRKMDDSISQARLTLDHADQVGTHLPADHPLLAFLAERKAWLNLDDWQISRSAKEFEMAIGLRQKSSDLGNLRSQFFIFFNQQGLAMAERLQGNSQASQKLLTGLAQQLAAALSDEKNYSTKQRSELRSRYLNTLERSADVPLFGGGDIAPAREPLRKALEFAHRELADESRLARHIDRIRYKLTVAMVLTSDRTADEVRLLASGRELTPLEQQYRELARLAVELSQDNQTSLEKLVELIFQVKLDDADRDDLEFLILACKVFFRFALNDQPQLVRVLRRKAQLLQSIAGRTEDIGVLHYLRPHFDEIIGRAAERSMFGPTEIAGWMLESRAPQLAGSLADVVILYFFEDRGLAVDIPAEGNGVILQLSFGVSKIHASRSDPSIREALAASIPAALRDRLKSIDTKKLHADDPVRDLKAADIAGILQSP